MSFTIIKSGIHSTIQDRGRYGFQKYGVPISGAMDPASAQLANLICGNEEHEGVIEFMLHDAKLFFNEPAFISICGSGAHVEINNEAAPFNRLLFVEAFSTLIWKPSAIGCYSYMAISGGLNIQKIMNSVSTFTPSRLGGLKGEALKSSDLIPFKSSISSASTVKNFTKKNGFFFSKWSFPIEEYRSNISIQFIKGPEWSLFSKDDQLRFSTEPFTVSSEVNRMGYRLSGQLQHTEKKPELISSAVTKGIIQVTHEGQPIILMADAQTTGGYPRIARVCPTDLPALAQSRPGRTIRFKEISEDQSKQNIDQYMNWFQQIKSSIHSYRNNL